MLSVCSVSKCRCDSFNPSWNPQEGYWKEKRLWLDLKDTLLSYSDPCVLKPVRYKPLRSLSVARSIAICCDFHSKGRQQGSRVISKAALQLVNVSWSPILWRFCSEQHLQDLLTHSLAAVQQVAFFARINGGLPSCMTPETSPLKIDPNAIICLLTFDRWDKSAYCEPKQTLHINFVNSH